MRSLRAVLLPFVVLTWLLKGSGAGASTGLLDVRANVDQEATTFFLRLGASANFSPVWISPRVFALDLANVTTGRSPKPQPLDSSLVSNYRLLTYSGAGGVPHLLLELELKADAKVEAVRASGGVEVTVHGGSNPAGSAQNVKAAAEDTPPESQALPPAAPPSRASSMQRGTAIQEIQVAKLEGTSALEVNIVGNGSLNYRTMRLSNPERLVLDMPNVQNRIQEKQLPVNTSPLRDVRVGQLSRKPLVSRVVMDLDSQTPYQVRPRSNALVITLGDSAARKSGEASAAKPVATAAPSAEDRMQAKADATLLSANVEPVVPKQSAGRDLPSLLPPPQMTGKMEEPHATEPEQPAQLQTEAGLLAIPATFVESSVPSETSQAPIGIPVPVAPLSPPSSNASISQKPLPSLTVPAQTGNHNDAESGLKSQVAAKEEPKELLAQQTPPAPAGVPPAASPSGMACQGPPFTGEPISVNLKDVDLKDFFRLIHEISSLNLVLDPDVNGTLTIVLDEIPWDQAMAIVLKNNHLVAQCEGNVVRIARIGTVDAEAKQMSETALAVEASQPLTPLIRSLNYAKALDLVATLKRFLSARGDIIADPRTNTLIIKDVPDRVAQIDTLLPTLDRKSQQVEIEARVVSASRSFARDIGVQLAASGLTGNITLGGTGLVGTSPISRGTTPPLFIGTPPAAALPGQPAVFANLPQPLLTNLPAAGPTSGFSVLLTAGSNFALDAIITAAESKGLGKLLSRPKIITQNNVEATVKQGVRIPIQTTINNTVSVQYVDVVLRLTVTPQITQEGTIFLKTDIENTSIDPGIATTPGQFGLDTQAATTQVLVTNGGTVFFGGVVQTVNRISQSEVPLLGSIPLIGNLFKQKSITSTSNELLFFITPRIVPS